MNNKNDPARNIPEPIKREVRQRCGFGCVICGFPLYDYDHMKEWSVVKEHVADDITLLCDKHHREVTSGLLPREKVAEHNEYPYNLKNGHSQPLLLHYSGDSCEFNIGGNNFIMESHEEQPVQSIPIMVDGIPLLSFILDKGHILLSAVLFDAYNNVVLEIRDNEIIYSISPWDIQIVGNTLTIREKARKILLNITFETPNKVKIDKARLLCNGVELLIKEELILVGNSKVSMIRNTFNNVPVGLNVGYSPHNLSSGVNVVSADRYESNSKEVEKFAREILKEFTNIVQ